MGLVEQYHADHKARLTRLGSVQVRPEPRLKKVPVIERGIDPEPFYPQMWFWALVNPTRTLDDYCPSIVRIRNVVSRHYGANINDLMSSRRTADIVLPRQIVMYLAKKLTRHSFPQIGRSLGGRDHSTVISGVRRIEMYVGMHPAMRATLDKLEREIMAL